MSSTVSPSLTETVSPTVSQVERSEEFAPVKNARGAPRDSPDTARSLLLALHEKWLREAGASVATGTAVEVSPLLSYEGEELAALYRGKCFDGGSMALELATAADGVARVCSVQSV